MRRCLLQLAVRPGVGARLALGCPSAALTVRLGYLLSAQPGQGTLHLSCQGCACARLPGRFASFSPFPVVETALQLSPLKQRDVDMTVTATTDFSMTYTRDRACQILVKHQRPRSTSHNSSSRVRVDSLYLWRTATEAPKRGEAFDPCA